MRIGLSYHGGDYDYEAYPGALRRRAREIGKDVETVWLAGKDRETRLDALAQLDAVVLTGGADVEPSRYGEADAERLCRCDPPRDAIEWELLERLQGAPLPLLAICRGAQMLNVFHGGTLLPDLGDKNAAHRRDDERDRRSHEVRLERDTVLRRITETAQGTVNSSHHQAVDRLAERFRISAMSDDGVVEAFEPAETGSGPLLLAVQWHPESMVSGNPLADSVLDAILRVEH